MKRKSITFYVGMLTLCAVLIALHSSGILAFIERPIGGVLAHSSALLASIRTLSQNNYVQQQTKRDEYIQALCSVKDQENKELRTLLNLKQHSLLQPIFATVIGFKDVLGKGRMLIDLGLSDDITEGMAVISSDQVLIGSIGLRGQASSEVILLSDDASSIIVSVKKNGVELLGIIHGSYQISTILDNVQNTIPLEQGDVIITSSLNLTIPEGLLIGTVQEVTSSQNDVFQKATVMPALRPESIRFVALVKK